MNKKMFFLISILFFVVDLSGQIVHKPRSSNRYNDESIVGIKFGSVFSGMRYSIAEFQEVDQKLLSNSSFGFFIDYHFNEVVSIAPELMLQPKGVYHNSYVFRNKYDASYKLSMYFVGFRLPIVFKMNVARNFQPYCFVAPELSYCIIGDLDYVLTPRNNSQQGGSNDVIGGNDNVVRSSSTSIKKYDIHKKITNADINEKTAGVILGLGARYRINTGRTYIIAKFDVGYNIGLMDTYGSAVNTVNKDMGERYHRALECLFSVGIPLNFFKDRPCVNFESVFDIWY